MSRTARDLWALAGVAAAAAAGLLAAPYLPLPEGDPLRGSLAVVPGIVAALAEIGRRARRAGARRVPAGWRRGEAIGLGLLVAAALARPHLALRGAEPVLVAGFVLLLAAVLAPRLLALRPLLGRRLPERPSLLFFFLPLTAYLALLPWSNLQRPPDGDEPWYLLITHSLAYDFDADLTNNYAAGDWQGFIDRPLEPQPGDPQGSGGELYSRHNALLPLVLAPAYRLAGGAGALATMAALTAALAWMTLRLARHYAPHLPGEALAAYALVAFAPPLLLYSYQVWVEVPAALLSMVALDAILALRRGPRSAGRWLTLALALALLPLLKIRFMLLAAPLLALAWWHTGGFRLLPERPGRPRRAAGPGRVPWRPLVALALALTALGAGILVYNQLHYANALKIHSWEEMELHRYSAVRYLAGFAGLFFDAAFGLFACAPLWLPLLPAALLLLARRHPLLLDLAVFAFPYLLIVAPRSEWYGGWSPPFRYALVALPLLGLALVPLLARRRQAGARALLAGLGALTLVLTAAWVAVPGWTYNFADGRTYLLDHLSGRLGADVARLFPSSVRLRPATWIWPAAALAVVTAAWWRPRRGVRRPALWGVAALLAAAAAVPWAAHRLPTRSLHFEDPQVVKEGGHLYPERWVIDRTRYRGGWVLRQGERLRAPVVAGGEQVELALEASFVPQHRPAVGTLEVLADGRLLAAVRLDRPRSWERLELGAFPWPAGADLELRFRPAERPGRPHGLIVDRLELAWR